MSLKEQLSTLKAESLSKKSKEIQKIMFDDLDKLRSISKGTNSYCGGLVWLKKLK